MVETVRIYYRCSKQSLMLSGTDSCLVIGQAGIEGIIIAGAVTMRCAAMLFDIFTHSLFD